MTGPSETRPDAERRPTIGDGRTKARPFELAAPGVDSDPDAAEPAKPRGGASPAGNDGDTGAASAALSVPADLRTPLADHGARESSQEGGEVMGRPIFKFLWIGRWGFGFVWLGTEHQFYRDMDGSMGKRLTHMSMPFGEADGIYGDWRDDPGNYGE